MKDLTQYIEESLFSGKTIDIPEFKTLSDLFMFMDKEGRNPVLGLGQKLTLFTEYREKILYLVFNDYTDWTTDERCIAFSINLSDNHKKPMLGYARFGEAESRRDSIVFRSDEFTCDFDKSFADKFFGKSVMSISGDEKYWIKSINNMVDILKDAGCTFRVVK